MSRRTRFLSQTYELVLGDEGFFFFYSILKDEKKKNLTHQQCFQNRSFKMSNNTRITSNDSKNSLLGFRFGIETRKKKKKKNPNKINNAEKIPPSKWTMNINDNTEKKKKSRIEIPQSQLSCKAKKIIKLRIRFKN